MNHELRTPESPCADDPLRAELALLAPAADVPDLADDRARLLKAQVLSEIRLEKAAATRPAKRAVPRRWKFVAVPALAAALAGAAIVSVSVVDGETDRPAVSAADRTAARTVLLQAALTVEAKQDLPVRDDQFTYIETISRYGVFTGGGENFRFTPGPETRSEYWRPVVASGETLRRSPGSTDYVSRVDNDPRRPGYKALSALPTDPGELLAHLRDVTKDHGDNPRDQEVFTLIGELLMDSTVPSQVTGALFRAAAMIPGVAVERGVSDSLGRPGVAVGMTEVQGSRVQIIFDELTAELIGERKVTAKADPGIGPKGTVLSTYAVVRSGVADTLGGAPVSVSTPATASAPRA